MIFVAIYDFHASHSEEVSVNAGDLMTIIDASDPDWSLVTVKSNFESPSGLVPKTYIEPAQSKYSVAALYDYSPQNEDEVSIVEGEMFNVFLDDDQDWFWGTNARNKDGLAPRNYFSTDFSPAGTIAGPGFDADAHLQKNKLLNALDGFGFAAAGPKKVPSEPKLELIAYLVTDNDKKKKKKGFLGIGEDYMVSFVDEKSKKTLYQYHIRDVSFSEKKSKKFIVNITQNGRVETKEYEGDKGDIQGLVAQFTQCQALTLGSPKNESAGYGIPAQVPVPIPVLQTEQNTVDLKKQQIAPKIVVALYDYTAADNQELSIVENENLLVLDDNDPDWWMVRSMKKGGKEGFVPKTYVQYKQKLGVSADTSQNLSHQTSTDSQHEARQSEMDHIHQKEDADALAREEAERIRNWKELEEQRIRWEKERLQKEAEEERLRQEAEDERRRQEEEEKNRLRTEQEMISSDVPKRSSVRASVVPSQPVLVPPPLAARPEIVPPAPRADIAPPPIASRPDILPPPISSRPEVFPPPIASRPEIAAPPIASRPEIAPPPIASRPEIAPPPIASRPEIAAPPIASRPEIAAPPIASRPEIAPPPIASRPEIAAPPIASRPDIAPPSITTRPEIPPPPIASRPSIAPSRTETKFDAPPPIASRPSFAPPIFARPEIAPAIPSRPSTEALGIASKNDAQASRIFPNYNIIDPESIIREWMDKTGTFKVKALLVNVLDNKVHLRKSDTGGKITIQLEKLHPNDIEYIRSIPCYAHVATTGQLAQKFPPVQNRKISQMDPSILAQAAAIKLSEPSPSNFVYNGLDWKDWLVKAGVSPGDAINYGQRFCTEKLDSSSISSLDRDLLRSLGVSEGDIIRIKRAIVDSISVDESSSSAREIEAQNRNLEKIRKVSSARSSFVAPDVKPEDLNNQKQKQIESDEAFARRLQFEEIQPQAKPNAQKSFSSNAVDLNAIKDASAILEASNNSSKNAPSVLRKSTTVNKNPAAFSTLPSTEDAITSSLGLKDQESSSKHNPWSIPGQESKAAPTTTPIETIHLPVLASAPPRSSIRSSLPPSVLPVHPAHPNPILAPGAQEALTKTQLQQKEAQLALQRAQYDLKMAQEQAKQAALIQEQTKRAQAQEAESALALAKAQEAARQAAMMKEQSERALRAAQAGMMPAAPSQNPQIWPYSGSVLQPNMGSMTSYTNGPPIMPNPTNRPYQMPGVPTGMMMGGPSGTFAPMAPNMMPQGGFPRPGLQAPLIPVGNPVNNAARPVGKPNTSKSNNPGANSNDPYAVFRSTDVNEPSIFTSQGAGMQNQSAQPYSQSNISYGQNPAFISQSSNPNFVQGQYMNPQGYYSNNFPAQFANAPQNQAPLNYASNVPPFINNQMPNQSQMANGSYQNSAGPNFMPPYQPGGNQGYNR